MIPKRHHYHMPGYKELPDGTFVAPDDYEVELRKYEEEIIERNRALELEERTRRYEDEKKYNRLKIEFETRNRFFITLATLSAATITLLIQYISDSVSGYGELSKLALKFSLAFFCATLMLCVLHNFANTRDIFNFSKKEENELIWIGFLAVSFYILGIGILTVTVINSF